MKTKDQVRVVGRPEFYSVLYVDMKRAALELGYTLAMHGSMHSDMDLIAVAWVEDAKPVEDLVKAINDCLGKTVWSESNLKTGEEKPHGRLCYTLSIGSDWFIDLSIIGPKSKLNLQNNPKKLITVKVPWESKGYFINNVGCLRYSINEGKESSCVEPEQIGEYLEKGKHQIIGFSFINGEKIVVIEVVN